MNQKTFLSSLCLVLSASLLFGASAVSARESEAAALYESELTGELIDASLKEQRPAAVMVDNESIAYPHFGMAEADVVYEIMNSTHNGRITRLMALVKDWDAITQMGSIRSTRPTNIWLAAEWNAILCHDGGPFYVNDYFARDYAREHLGYDFSRVKNGKAYEFTEYILAGDIARKLAQYGFSRTYNAFRPERESHFLFQPQGTETDLTGYPQSQAAARVLLPFPHTSSALSYNSATGTYDYYCYGDLHVDAEDQEVMTFKNVILQDCDYYLYDQNGYMAYSVIDSGRRGYYITNGRAIPITWTKESESGLTRYYTGDGAELTVNRGKTYICLVPSDMWDSLSIES